AGRTGGQAQTQDGRHRPASGDGELSGAALTGRYEARYSQRGPLSAYFTFRDPREALHYP
ncbi:MAG TPA: hypothetical protein PKD43_18105, partial [Nitrospira sp.]|nr:hypothetical protein [Nitrospira sp.]